MVAAELGQELDYRFTKNRSHYFYFLVFLVVPEKIYLEG